MWDYLTANWVSYLSGVGSVWLAYGIGLGAVLWMIGQGMRLIYDVMRY